MTTKGLLATPPAPSNAGEAGALPAPRQGGPSSGELALPRAHNPWEATPPPDTWLVAAKTVRKAFAVLGSLPPRGVCAVSAGLAERPQGRGAARRFRTPCQAHEACQGSIR
jgi:hypothetical protein